MRRVAWIRTGALGDLLVGSAGLFEALQMFPEAEVTVVGSALWLQILKPGFFKQIDQIAVIDKKSTTARIYSSVNGEWQESGSQHLFQLFRTVDVVVNSRPESIRQAAWSFLARVPERWGAARGSQAWVYNRRGVFNGKDPLIHERDVPLLMMDEIEKKVDLKLSLSERIKQSPRIQFWRQQGLPRIFPARPISRNSKPTILINPTSSRREKAWPAEKFARLYELLKEVGKFDVLILGSPNETEWLLEVTRGSHENLLQPRSVQDLATVVAEAKLLITNTSSVQFIAAAVGTTTLTLMGQAKASIWGPLGKKDQFVRGQDQQESDLLMISDLFLREQTAYSLIKVESVYKKVFELLEGIEL